MEKSFDRGTPLTPVVGATYKNRNGEEYICLDGNVEGKIQFRRRKDGWTLLASGTRIYDDGCIQWASGSNGYFAKGGIDPVVLKLYPEMVNYDPEDNEWDMNRPAGIDEIELPNLNRYEIVFELCGQKYYCFADAVNEYEALGQFFKNHPHVTYDKVVEYMEI